MENTNSIAKPLSLLKNEYICGIVELTNNSGLPLFVVEYLLKDLLGEVHRAANKQEEDELSSYNNMVKNNTDTENDASES